MSCDFVTQKEFDECWINAKTAHEKQHLITQFSKPLKYDVVKYYYTYSNSHDVRKGKTGAKVSLFFGQWLDRNLKSKGVAGLTPFLTRRMTRDEAIDHALQYRMHSTSYRNWDTLIKDDRMLSVPEEDIQKIIEFSKKHQLTGPPSEQEEPHDEESYFLPIKEPMFKKITKRYALVNSYFKSNQGAPDTLEEIQQYMTDHGELPFKYEGDNWPYDAMVERQKRRGVNASQFLTPDTTARRIAQLAKMYGGHHTDAVDMCAGTGQLTKFLLHEGFKVFAGEVDVMLIEFLKNGFSREIAAGTITVEQFSYKEQMLSKPYDLIVSNPPYEDVPLFMQWVDFHLTPGGIAVVLLPPGMLQKTKPKPFVETMSNFKIELQEPMTEKFARTNWPAEITVLRKHVPF